MMEVPEVFESIQNDTGVNVEVWWQNSAGEKGYNKILAPDDLVTADNMPVNLRHEVCARYVLEKPEDPKWMVALDDMLQPPPVCVEAYSPSGIDDDIHFLWPVSMIMNDAKLYDSLKEMGKNETLVSAWMQKIQTQGKDVDPWHVFVQVLNATLEAGLPQWLGRPQGDNIAAVQKYFRGIGRGFSEMDDSNPFGSFHSQRESRDTTGSSSLSPFMERDADEGFSQIPPPLTIDREATAALRNKNAARFADPGPRATGDILQQVSEAAVEAENALKEIDKLVSDMMQKVPDTPEGMPYHNTMPSTLSAFEPHSRFIECVITGLFAVAFLLLRFKRGRDIEGLC
eukprot:gnl/MRDRNA2_/MRDRNA2_137904_c0_seq1.p1 gnl/MRDRNA2_/MRDRNA2_137904_c0~~gnl/MRDRNA2_/MRDRNA2_137904_c0_seq1.p1  ORF type:complete len:342 (+),score=67.82 gnl/MRDRNA2_/MRDRNA2_137904_c0_seq1:119-1144(+)